MKTITINLIIGALNIQINFLFEIYFFFKYKGLCLEELLKSTKVSQNIRKNKALKKLKLIFVFYTKSYIRKVISYHCRVFAGDMAFCKVIKYKVLIVKN